MPTREPSNKNVSKKASQSLHLSLREANPPAQSGRPGLLDVEGKKKARELRVLNEVGIPIYKDYNKPNDYTEIPQYSATW